MLGKEKLFSYLDLFGFGSKTGIDLNGESEGIIFLLDKVYYEVPNVEGWEVKDAKKVLTTWKIEYVGSGNRVITQNPNAGERLAADETVVLLLGDE